MTDFVIKGKRKIFGLATIIVLGIVFNYQVMLMGRVSIGENILSVANGRLTGYLTQASEVKDIREFMSEYHVVLKNARGMPEHIDVHPPGNTFYSYLFVLIVKKASPLVKATINAIVAPWEIIDSENLIVQTESYSGTKNISLDDYNYTSILIVISFLLFIALSQVLLLISILILKRSSRSLGICAFFLWTIPAPILFLGSYDTLYYSFTCMTCLLLSLWISSKRMIYLFLLGIFCSFCMLFSIGFAPVIILLTLILIFDQKAKMPDSIRSLTPFMLGGLFSIVVYYILDIHIIEILLQCITNNRRFVGGASRSIAWCVANYLDYILFIGVLPIFFLCLFFKKSILSKFHRGLFPEGLSTVYLFVLIFIMSSSFCRGESGRLILLLIPFNILIACYGIQCFSGLDRKKYLLSLFLIGVSIVQLVVLRIWVMTLVQF